jgi:hypothetical protein
MTQLFTLLCSIATAFARIFVDGLTRTDDELCAVALETCCQIQTTVAAYRRSHPFPVPVPVPVSSVKDADTLRDEEMQAAHLSFLSTRRPFWDVLKEKIFTCVNQILTLDGEYEQMKRLINSMTFPSEFKRSINYGVSDVRTPTKPLFTFRMTVDDYLLDARDITRVEAIEFFNMLEKYKPDRPRCNTASTNGFDMKIEGEWIRFNEGVSTLDHYSLYSWFGGWDGEHLTVELHPTYSVDVEKAFGQIMWTMEAASYGLSVSDYKIGRDLSPDDRLARYPARPHVPERFEFLESYFDSDSGECV